MTRLSAVCVVALLLVSAFSIFVLREKTVTNVAGSDPITGPSHANSEAENSRQPGLPHAEDPEYVREKSKDFFFSSDLSAAIDSGSAGARQETHDSGVGGTAVIELLTDTTVIGQAFPISPSVKRQCAPSPEVPKRCAELDDFLSEMAKEPRDLNWALPTEARLKKSILATDPPIYKIRAMDCRTTLCAVEVWARDEPWDGFLDNDPELFNEFGQVRDEIGLETGPEGEEVVVTLRVYRRR